MPGWPTLLGSDPKQQIRQMTEYCVYRHVSPAGKVYIGLTSQNPVRRWAGGNGYRNNQHFYRAILKYGWDNFKHEIVQSGLTKEDACRLEIELIAAHNSTNAAFGYNHSTGGESGGAGLSLSDSAKQKLREAIVGRKLTEEHKAKLRAAKIGKRRGPQSADTIRKRIETRRANGTLSTGPWSETARVNHRKSVNMEPANSRSVKCLDTGVTYPTIRSAARDLNLHPANIGAVCRGRLKRTGGMRFTYV